MMFSPCAALDAVEADAALARARGGDAAGFEALVHQHQSMVFGLAYHYFAGDSAAAEDVAQDVFLELFRTLGRIESPAHLTFWLRRVTANRCIDRFRRRRFERPAGDALPDRGASEAPRDVLLEQRVHAVIRALPDHARAVMALRFQEDLDISEIAQVLGIPVNTVKSHIRRSLGVLRKKLGVEDDA